MKIWISAALLLVATSAAALVSSGAAVVSGTTSADLRPFVRGSWHRLLQAHTGQSVVVHFWGLSCGPCLAELPAWAAEIKRRPDLNVILVDADPYGDDANAVRKVLAQDGLARLENWIFADNFDERLRFEVNPQWQGEMPYTLLVARDGKVRAVVGQMDFTDLNTWLDQQKAGS